MIYHSILAAQNEPILFNEVFDGIFANHEAAEMHAKGYGPGDDEAADDPHDKNLAADCLYL
jgi:hypothetical protein